MQTLYVAAFLLFAGAALFSIAEKAWVWVALCGGLACYVAPAAFQLTS